MEQTDEFDDIDRSQAPFISSPKAIEAMRQIAAKNGLTFTYNPGGGEFTRLGFRCQISTFDDIEDLNRLRTELEHHRGHDPRTSGLRVQRSAN